MRTSRPLIYILWPEVQFQFLLWLPLIQKPTHAKVSNHEQHTNRNGPKHEPGHLYL